MTAIGAAEPGLRRPRLGAALSALIFVAAAAAALALFPTDLAIGGGWVERAAIPGRMLALLWLATLLLRLNKETWADVGMRRPRPFWRVPLLVIGGYAVLGAAAAGLTLIVLPALGIAPETHALFGALRGDFGEYLYWLLPVAWGSAAVGEELVFRGFLQSRLERMFGASLVAGLLAALTQAAIFGALHLYQGAGGALVAGATGFVIGLVYLCGGRNLWACIILHGLIDTVSLTAIYAGAAG